MATEEEPAPRKMGRIRLFFVLFSSFLTLIAAEAISVGYGVDRYWRGVVREEITRNLTEKARMFAAFVNSDRTHKITDLTSQAGLNAGARATVIDENQRVIADSQMPLSALENEGHRPEFQAALRGDPGIEMRRQGLFGVSVLYVAVPISGGAVRLAYPLGDIVIASSHGRHILLLGALIAILAALAISVLATGMVYRQTRP
jgi:two-component system, OmpR family, phosphate regulon sensor histidine kinase PhoR